MQNILNLERSINYGDESKLTVALEKYEFDHKYVMTQEKRLLTSILRSNLAILKHVFFFLEL